MTKPERSEKMQREQTQMVFVLFDDDSWWVEKKKENKAKQYHSMKTPGYLENYVTYSWIIALSHSSREY